MKTDDNLQTLQRGLRVLALLNLNGPSSVSEMAKNVSVSRPTAYRLLETLATEGYCGRVPGTRKYRVLPTVRRLSRAINDEELLTAVALDPIDKLAAEIKWPLTLVTPSETSMLVRITTDHDSPFALSRIPPGVLVSMRNTTTGLVYLALVDAKTRAKTVARLRAGAADSETRADPAKQADLDVMEGLMAMAARNRYLILERPTLREGNLGVPVMDRGHPIGGIAMRYIKTALRHDELVERYLPRLRRLSEDISARYQRYKSDSSIDFDFNHLEHAAL
jgi:IclR family mhp operon transcriptional activator